MILFVTRKYPPSIGGMQRLSHQLTTAIAARRPSHVISWGGSQGLLPWFVLSAILRTTATKIARPDVDLIHVGDALLAPVGLLFKRLFAVPVVATCHGLDVTYPNRLYQSIVPAALRRLDIVVAISRHAESELVKRQVHPERCRVVPPGITIPAECVVEREAARLDLLRRGLIQGKGPLLLTVGRLVPRKGVATFVERALPDIVGQVPDAQYLVIGSGPDRDRIEATARRVGLESRVRLAGSVDDALLGTAYRAADLFVMPNVLVPGDPEGFGMVILEAAAAGLWTVATDCDGIGEAIRHGLNGELVPAGAFQSFARIVVERLLEPESTRRSGRAARQFVADNFSWGAAAEQYLRVFDDLRSGSRVPPAQAG